MFWPGDVYRAVTEENTGGLMAKGEAMNSTKCFYVVDARYEIKFRRILTSANEEGSSNLEPYRTADQSHICQFWSNSM